MSDFWNEQNIWVHIQNPQTINTTINKIKYDSPTVQVGVEVIFFSSSWSTCYPIKIEKHKSNNAISWIIIYYYKYFRITAAVLMCEEKREAGNMLFWTTNRQFFIILFVQKIEPIFDYSIFTMTTFSSIINSQKKSIKGDHHIKAIKRWNLWFVSRQSFIGQTVKENMNIFRIKWSWLKPL